LTHDVSEQILGVFRLLLALFVLLGHLPGLADWTNPLFGRMNAGIAVQAFFILSGFYMAMILAGKYSLGSPKSFYYSRLLKIFPIYYAVLLSGVIICLLIATVGLDIYEYGNNPPSGYDYPSVISNVFFKSFGLLDPLSIVLLLLSHIFLIGQDFVYGLVTTPTGITTVGEFRMTEVFRLFAVDAGGGEVRWQPRSNVPYMTLEKYLFVPQAWSLGLELMFYAIAPFLLRIKSAGLIGLTVLFLALRLFMLELTDLGLNGFFQYKFFPFELGFFLIGILSFKCYQFLEDSDFDLTSRHRYGAALLLCVVALCYDLLPDPKNWIFFSAVAILLPISFKFDSSIASMPKSVTWDRIDRFLGDLSYPLYISHLLVVAAAYGLFQNQMRFLGRSIGQTIVILVSIALAAVLLRFVQGPIDRYRWRYAQVATETRAERRRKGRNKGR